MNEKIKELAEQAEKYALDNVSKGHCGFEQFVDTKMAKFAELIVKECLTFVEPMPGSGDIDDLALEAAREGIKEHFGVKE